MTMHHLDHESATSRVLRRSLFLPLSGQASSREKSCRRSRPAKAGAGNHPRSKRRHPLRADDRQPDRGGHLHLHLHHRRRLPAAADPGIGSRGSSSRLPWRAWSCSWRPSARWPPRRQPPRQLPWRQLPWLLPWRHRPVRSPPRRAAQRHRPRRQPPPRPRPRGRPRPTCRSSRFQRPGRRPPGRPPPSPPRTAIPRTQTSASKTGSGTTTARVDPATAPTTSMVRSGYSHPIRSAWTATMTGPAARADAPARKLGRRARLTDSFHVRGQRSGPLANPDAVGEARHSRVRRRDPLGERRLGDQRPSRRLKSQ